ncbi:glycosyltransferase [Alpinimonas psychrophila]|uniref:Cellulose synthase/poly-beta-1,6-N-acetylglucosamine synthase-like glycosyltransferase n=1 Tax=Alpinimonas psychrophila TaxID=748908 RepID=A0A7W3JV13_9MICO|nr:glycosyltransferase [Alpinimonas psychrophila]MBA8829720.1 cellulose synthase/poly-beta-1,6-N-acetylglucosamine synthase-like glycosyltransferase [Alpinimonas psychrophila]
MTQREEAHKPIGQILVSAGHVTELDVQNALESQRLTGGRVGQILILDGAISRLDFYAGLASQMGVPFINLMENSPDAGILDDFEPTDLVQAEWIPFHRDGGVLTIVTSIPLTPPALEEIRTRFNADSISMNVTTNWDITQTVMRYCRARLLFNAAEALANNSPDRSAKSGLRLWQKIVTGALACALIAGFIFERTPTVVTLLVVANVLFLIAVSFRTLTSIVGAFSRHDADVVAQAIAAAHARTGGLDDGESGEPTPNLVPEPDLPVYTILVPVFHEANVVTKVIHHIGQLDWPTAKLQVLLIMEEDDVSTIQACKDARPPEYVDLLIVPAGSPMTKPRACNFALMFAQGDFLVIFDAEDRPDPNQLRVAYAAFLAADEATALDPTTKPLVCVQASLNYFNSRQNVLTRMFTLEYSTWFDGMLPGMEALSLPIPLGGTSNHFRTPLLRQLGGWDPYNVTEDADLGMRAAVAKFRITTINSTTWEEACSEVPAWIRQRTRWIKGYMVTALVDARFPVRFLKSAGWRGAFSSFALIASTPLLFLSYPLVWGFTILTYMGVRFSEFDLPPVFATAAVWNAVVGNLCVIALAAYAGWRRQGWRLASYALVNPAYWFLHSYAAWRAFGQLILKPFSWEKTPHGLDNRPLERGEVT